MKKTVIKIALAFGCLSAAGWQAMGAIGANPPTTGNLWAMGANNYGQLGDGGTDHFAYFTNRPEQIVSGNVTAVSGGYYFSLFIEGDGSLWAIGQNNDGQLGDGSTDNGNYSTNKPEQIVPGGATTVTAVAAGGFHSLFIKSDGSLWGMGYNALGQLGDGNYNNATVPTEILPGGVKAIAAGYSHTLYLMTNGSLWAVGNNVQGELGNGGVNYYTDQPYEVETSGVTAIAAGSYHSLFLMSNGSLWGMGDDDYGQLGNDSEGGYVYSPIEIESSGVTSIAAGAETSLFLKNDGSLWGMGTEQDGTLGDGTTDYAVTTPEMIEPGNVTAIAQGGYTSMFVKNDGSLWTMGQNDFGQVGNGGDSNVTTPTEIETGGVVAMAAGFEHCLFVQSVPQPDITSISRSGTNVVITAADGIANGAYATLTSPLISNPINDWTPIQTNVLSASGNFTITVTNGFNAATPQAYFMLELQ